MEKHIVVIARSGTEEQLFVFGQPLFEAELRMPGDTFSYGPGQPWHIVTVIECDSLQVANAVFSGLLRVVYQ